MTFVLAALLLLCLVLIPLGLPGTWLMIAIAIGYPYVAGVEPFGALTIVGVTVLALIAEVLEFSLSARYTRKYGGSRRAGWGAIIGGIVGAVVGVPVPIVGPVIGAFVGSFLGALAAELSRGSASPAATRVATGALLGRLVATALKVGVGMVILVWVVLAAWRGVPAGGV